MHFTLRRKGIALWTMAVLLLGVAFVSVYLLFFNAREESPVYDDFAEIMSHRNLVAVVHPNSTNYFIYKAEPMGFQYEMLQAFTRHLGVKLTIISARYLSETNRLLQNGQADLVASDLLLPAPGSNPGVHYSLPYMSTRHILVQRKPKNWRSLSKKQFEKKLIRSPSQLNGKRVYAPGWSVLVGPDRRLPGLNIKVQMLQGVEPERIMEMVSKGEMQYAVVGQHIAEVLSRLYPNLDISTLLSAPLYVGWAVRSTSPQLQDSLNVWMDKFIHTPDYASLYEKFHNKRDSYASIHTRDPKSGLGSISVFDKAIKVYSAQIGWDWRLVASLICQESRFDPSVRSRAGAYGLMQLMPQTLRNYGIETGAGSESQIRAGVKYLKYLEKMFLQSVPKQTERVKFALAAYNIGVGHILDAQSLAKHFGKNPALWDGNVDTCLMMKSNPKVYSLPEVRNGSCKGKETNAFVHEVMERYQHYTNIVTR